MKASVTLIAVAATAMSASAQQVLSVDLTVSNEITISSTGAAAANSGSGSSFTGFLLADLLNTAGAGGGTAAGDGIGDLTTGNNASDLSPALFNGAASVGMNVWAFTADGTASVTAGDQAFDGSATWSVDAAVYGALLAGNMSGDVYMGADTDDDIAAGGATFVGTWAVVPAPSSLALLGLGGVVAGRRRR